jgi:pimeloyl-ACP methyl ester carboxylesterase
MGGRVATGSRRQDERDPDRGGYIDGSVRRVHIAVLFVALAVLTTAGAVGASGAPRPVSAAALRALLVSRATAGLAPAGRATGARVVAGTAATPCGETPGLLCSQVNVPLDRSGQTPGTISLHVEVLPADGVQRGVMFLIAGGPGQGSAHVYGLGTPSAAALYRFLFPGYTLVAYDDRGTGASGLLDCPSLQTSLSADAQQSAATACAGTLGAQRTFYSTADHAEDLEAVRQSLGVDKIGLFGVSYGTKLAMAYALAHPDHVERLLLDSVLPPELPDPYGANVLRTLPATLNEFCSDGGCRAATRNFGAEVVALANKLAATPLQGKVLEANGRTATERLDGLSFLSMVLDADLNPGLAAELPAVVHAARLGNTQPLLRLGRIHDATSVSPSVDLSFALYAATVCRDGPFPWQPDTPPADRPALFRSAVSALPPGTFGAFGSWAARFGNADFCLGWPSPAGGATLGPGPLPDVPMLAVSGGFDMRTPTAGAVSVVSRFPQGHLLVVPGVGHSTVTADPSACAAQAVRSWMQGGAVPAQCPRPKALVTPIPALPSPGSVPPKPLGPLQTYAVVTKTIREAEAMWLTTGSAPAAGVFSGKLVPGQNGFALTRYSISRGVELSGRLRVPKAGLPLTFEGTVTVGGAAAAQGIVGLSAGGSLRGTLGGRLVGR